MIVAVACVPQAPLLLPDLTGGSVPEVEKMRAAVRGAVAAVVEQGVDEVVVVGGAPRTQMYPPHSPAPGGRLAPTPARRPHRESLPVSLAIGRSVLAEHSVPWVAQGVEHRAPRHHCHDLGRQIAARPGRIGLLVVGDGSARRGEKAPGHIDSRALGADARIANALDPADPHALLALDPDLCEELLIAGRAAWHVMSAATEGTAWLARTLYSDDPFGVAYWVVSWVRRG